MNKLILAVSFLLQSTSFATSSEECTDTDYRYQTASELSEYFVASVVRISSTNLDNIGFGIVIGQSKSVTYIATATHVVRDTIVNIQYCQDQSSQKHSAKRDFVSKNKKITILKTSLLNDYAFPRRGVVAINPGITKNNAYYIGEQSNCVVPGDMGRLTDVIKGFDSITGEFEAIRSGSSGGPVVTGDGIVGLLEDVQDNSPLVRRVTISRLDKALTAFAKKRKSVWLMGRSCNIPPGDPQQAKRDITALATGYLFQLNNLMIAFRANNQNKEARGAIITTYSNSFKSLYSIRHKYVSTIRESWGEGVKKVFEQLLDETEVLHRRFIELNEYDLYSHEGLPQAVVDFIAQVEPNAQKLESSWGNLLEKLEN